MIDLDALKSAGAINVEPSDRLFEELGNNTYDYRDVLSELIDNAIAAARDNEPVTVTIDVFIDKNNLPSQILITDDATGIPQDRLGKAISPAGFQSKNSLNEHGLGMKQAIAALGRLKYLATKTEDESDARLIKELKFGTIETFKAPFSGKSGTVICVEQLKAIVNVNQAVISRSLIPALGARYRRFLKEDKRKLHLTLTLRKMAKPKAAPESKWVVNAVKPTYFHPSTRDNRPVIEAHQLTGNGWSAELTFGYAPQSEAEYDELGIDPPGKFHPYKVSLSRQGIDVLLQDRIILPHVLSELDIVPMKHNDYNATRGELSLTNGFCTAITKNAVIHDVHFRECIQKVSDILNGKAPGPKGKVQNYLTRKSYPEELPENLLRDRLKKWLTTNDLQPRQNAKIEYAVNGIEGFIDILADDEAWELKVNQATALDVYQLFMYMDVGKIEKGFLVGSSFSPGAKVAAEHINKTHKKKIILSLRTQFPINDAPSTTEREEYY